MIHIVQITWAKSDLVSTELLFSTHMIGIVAMPDFMNSGTLCHSLVILTNQNRDRESL